MNGYEEAEYVVGEISRAHRENGAKYKELCGSLQNECPVPTF